MLYVRTLTSTRVCAQSLGIASSNDRDLLKKHLRGFKTSIENEKKLRAKEQKERERLEKHAKKKATNR